MDGHFFVTASYDKLIKVWSSTTFVLIKTLAGHENKVMSTDICPDGSGVIASASYDRTIKLWAPDDDLSMHERHNRDMMEA
jgi:U4/U6 small nuclear ribonucleoprotein PRP4